MEDSDEELPAITVQFLSQECTESGGSGSMPSAGDIAAERERERRVEDELRRLRDIELRPASDQLELTARTDSSGSEGEVALAAAVRALQVPDARSPRRRSHAAGIALAGAMLRQPGAPRLHALYAAALHRSRALVHAAAAAAEPCAAPDALLTLVAAALAAPSVRGRRTLHRALADAAEDAVAAVAAVAAAAAAECGAKGAPALLRLADTTRGGAGGARLLSELVVRYGLQLLLGSAGAPPSLDELTAAAAARGRHVHGAARVSALRLCARSRHAPLVSALTAAPPDRRAHKDSHQVAVAASTLRLLYQV